MKHVYISRYANQGFKFCDLGFAANMLAWYILASIGSMPSQQLTLCTAWNPFLMCAWKGVAP